MTRSPFQVHMLSCGAKEVVVAKDAVHRLDARGLGSVYRGTHHPNLLIPGLRYSQSPPKGVPAAKGATEKVVLRLTYVVTGLVTLCYLSAEATTLKALWYPRFRGCTIEVLRDETRPVPIVWP